MVPNYINREFLTGPRKFDEIMEKLEIVVNEMMADDGPVSKILGMSVRTTRRRHRATRTQASTCHTKTCAPSPGKGTRLAREQAKRDRMGQDHGIVEKELAEEMTEARKEARRVPRAANLIGTATRTRGSMGAKGNSRAKAWARAKPDTTMTAASKGMSG